MHNPTQDIFKPSILISTDPSESCSTPPIPLNPILPSERFPCFLCSPSNYQTSTCQLCSNTGQLFGDNPFVNLIQQIIAIELRPKQDTIDERPQVFYHQNFICDQCQMDPIAGVRYSCKDCNDYDLCQECYHKKNHKHKVFEKIENKKASRESPVKKRLTQTVQKEKLLGLGKSYINKILQ